jgi:hypothetical protein
MPGVLLTLSTRSCTASQIHADILNAVQTAAGMQLKKTFMAGTAPARRAPGAEQVNGFR